MHGSHDTKNLLRFIACGSARDGASTLIERLACESRATGRRKFIAEDARGLERYACDAVSGAPLADAAVILVDARHGVLTQTRRLAYLASLLGIRHVAVAVNKMDLVGYSESSYRDIEATCREFGGRMGLGELTCIPVSALEGENIRQPGRRTPWYQGATLTGWLEAVEIDEEKIEKLPFRFPVQSVSPLGTGIRGLSGTVASGVVRPGDRVRVQPAGKQARVARIVTAGADSEQAVAGQSITLALADDIEAARGDLVCAADEPAQAADQFEATIVWMDGEPMLRGRTYAMKIGGQTAAATIAPLKYKLNVTSLEHVAADKLETNEIGVCELELDRRIAFDAYADNRLTGGFVLIDRLTGRTVGAGMLRFALRRSHNIHVQHLDVDKAARAALKHQRPCVLWFTGLPGAGKSTIANLLEKKLHAMGRHTYTLDGDNVRHGLTKDLGFTAEDRVENIRRIAEVAKLMADAGLIVIAAFISPFRAERRMARGLLPAGEFIEVFVDAPLSVAEQRDPKGLYKKARRGEIKNFTGIDSPYEEPEAPEIRLDTARLEPEDAVGQVLDALERMGIVSGD